MMLKKCLVILMSLIGTFSVVYVINNQMNAATTTQMHYPIRWKVIWKDSSSNKAVAMPTNYFYFDGSLAWNSKCYGTGTACNADLWKAYEEGEYAQKTKSVIEEVSDSFIHLSSAYDTKGLEILEGNKDIYYNYSTMSTLKTSYLYNLPAGGSYDQGTNLTYPNHWTTLSELTNGFTDFYSNFAGRGITLPNYVSTISTKNGDFTSFTALVFYNNNGIYTGQATSMGGNSYVWPYLTIPSLPSTVAVGDTFTLGHSSYDRFGTAGFEYSPDLIEYTPAPKKFGDVTDKYEYSKNVAPKTQVGSILYKSSEKAEITLQKKDGADAIHDNDFKNFSITDLDANHITSDKTGTIQLQVASDAPALTKNSLKANTYIFQIKCKDVVTNEVFIKDVSIEVGKTTATIAFKDTTALDIFVGDANVQGAIETSNTDTLIADNVEYTLADGVSDVLTVGAKADDLLTYDLDVVDTYTGSQLPTTYTLSAKIKETENFKSVETSTNRTVNVAKSMSAPTWTPTKDGFSPSDVDKSGSVVGSLKGVGGVAPYTYALVKSTDEKYDPIKGSDNSSFMIDTTTATSEAVKVKTNTALAPKTYHMQFKVTDAKGKAFYSNVTIIVSTKSQPPLNFKDSSGGNTINTVGKKVKFDDKTSSLLAEGGSDDNVNAIEYDYAPSDMQAGLSPEDYATINKTSGLITPIRTGKIKVQAKRAGGGIYDDVVVYMDLTIEAAEQKVTFNDTSSVISVKEGASKKVDASGTIKSSGLAGIGSIVYSIDDTSIATVNKATGDVTGVKAGSVTLSATMNKTGESGYNSNYDTVTATKTIKVYAGMNVTYAPTSPKVKANANTIGDKVGTLSVSDNASDPSFTISSNSTNQNIDASFFKVVDNGTSADIQLAKTISASDWESHGGSFKVQVNVSDSNETKTTDVVVTLDEAENDAYFTDGGNKITTLTKKYGEDANTFTLTAKTDGKGTTYSVASDPNNILTVLATGVVTINKAGSATVQVLAGAGNGYAQKTVTMAITIDSGDQSVSFKDSATTKRQFVSGSTFDELAELKETSKNTISTRAITYATNSPSVCSIATNGKVTMLTKGTCEITAANTDANWTTTTITKQISLYDKMSVSYTAVSPKLKANANAIGDKVGMLSVSDNASDPSFVISSNTTTQNIDASFFKVVDNGTTADVQLAKTISASDWESHGGSFKVQVDVTDSNGTETADVIVTLDEADNDAYFTEGGNKITALTKQYGENTNAFTLTSKADGKGTTYSEVSDPDNVLSVLATGDVTINKAGSATVQVLAGAGNGYAQKIVTMVITIDPGDQSIAFKDTVTINQPFTLNATFSEVAELKETSAEKLSSRTITYTSNSTSVCTIDSRTGLVSMKAKGNCDITATNSDANWTSVTTNKVINLYDGMGVSFTQTPSLQAETTNTSASAKAGNLTVNGGIDPKTYAIATVTGAKNKDASLFQVNSSGIVSFKKAIMASDLVGKYNTTKKVYELYVQIETTDSLHTKVTTDALVEIKGAPLKAAFDTNGTGKITEVYGLNKTFPLDLSSNKGGGTPTYQLKGDASMPSDVLQSVDPSGLVTILHANDKAFVGNPLKVEAVIPPSNGYDGETIDVEVEITPATQPDFAFVTPNIKLGHGAILTPTFKGNLSSGSISMTSGNNALATISGKDIKAKTTDGKVTITAVESGDRDYQSAVTTATVTIDSAPSYSLIVSVPGATYGDTNLKATANAIGSIGTNPSLAWSSSDARIADIDASGNITIKKAGTVTITCTRVTTGEPSVTASAILVVDPKPITVTIDNAEKYVGEAVPSFHASIPTDDIVGSDTIDQPIFSCKDGSALVDANTKAGTYDISGTYPTESNPNYDITVSKGILTIKQDASLASWYHLEGAESGNTLSTDAWYKEDVNVVLDSAIVSSRVYDEISIDNTLWDSLMIPVSVEGEHNKDVFFRMNASGIISTKQSTSIKIDKTKPLIKNITGTETNKDAISQLINKVSLGIFFKPGTKISIVGEEVLPKPSTKVSGLKDITYEIYEIDKTTGMKSASIDSGTQTPDAKGKIEVTLNDVGLYRVCAVATDKAENEGIEKCSDVNIKKIDMDIDGDGENEYHDSDEDGCADINIPLRNEKGEIYKLNVDRDGDDIPDLNIDSDGDGVADINVDTDDDQSPDLDLIRLTTWTPTYCATEQVDSEGQLIEYCTMKDIVPVINVRTSEHEIPDINIDSDGDMIADINIDQNKNKKLDANDYNITTKLDTWTPDDKHTSDKFVFDTQGELKPYINQVIKGTEYPSINIDSDADGTPDLNIDINLDGLPDVEIDGDGNGVADINLDPEGTGTPQSNIRKITQWSPSILFMVGENKFLTMSLQGSNELEDNGVIIDKPSGETFLPNFAFKTEDVTNIISESDKEKITSILDEGIEIKQVYSVSLLKDDASIQPDGIVRVKIPVLKGLKNPKLVIAQKDGTYKIIEAVEVDGYYIYETDYLSMVSVVGDIETKEPTPDEKPDITLPDAKPGPSGGSTPDVSVKGDYSGNIGGAGTGDTTNVASYLLIMGCMLACLSYKGLKRK